MLKKALLLLGIAVFGLGIAATVDLPNQRPRLPVSLGGEHGLEVLGPNPDFSSGQEVFEVGDRIISLEGERIPDKDYLNFLLDGLRVSDRVSLGVLRGGEKLEIDANLVRLLTSSALIINLIVSLGVWGFGMLILLKGSLDRDILLFYGQAMTLSIVMFVYWPENTLGFEGGQRVSYFLSNGLYPFTVALVLHFAIFFPEELGGWLRKLVPFLYVPTVMIAGLLIWAVWQARSSQSYADFVNYRDTFKVFRIYLALYFVASPVIWGVKYKLTNLHVTRQRLKWLFWGFTMGISPHVLLHELPKGLGLPPLLPEEATHLCALIAASAMLIAIARYRLLDVDLVIKRSIVYTFLTLFVVFAYLFLVGLGDQLVVQAFGGGTTWVRVVVVLLLAMLFAPARNLAQSLVDRTFFRTQHDQRVALMEYSRDLARTIDISELSARLSRLLSQVIPTRSLRIFASGEGEGEVIQVFPSEQEGNEEPQSLSSEELASFGIDQKEGAFPSPDGQAGMEEVSLLVPLRVDKKLVGLITLGEKKSGLPFHDEDLRFVNAVADQTAVAFERARAFKTIRDLNICLEQKVFERTAQLAEANDRLLEQFEKLRKLDELKEALTRMVIHDLRNPVSTILLGMEFLDHEDKSKLPEGVSHSLEIIRNTVREMQDLINNLLDATRLESGKLQLNKEKLPVSSIVEEGVSRVRVLAESRKVSVEVDVENDLSPNLDRSLITRVLVNLLTNAVKFTPREGSIEVKARSHDGKDDAAGVCLAVTNSGPVIPDELHDKIFEKFFQISDQKAAAFAGLGLGLSFCKLVVEAHNGRIDLTSPAPGSVDGARFSVILPL